MCLTYYDGRWYSASETAIVSLYSVIRPLLKRIFLVVTWKKKLHKDYVLKNSHCYKTNECMNLLCPAVNGKRYSCQKLNKIYSTINTNNKRYVQYVFLNIFFLWLQAEHGIFITALQSTDSHSTFRERSSTPEEETGSTLLI